MRETNGRPDMATVYYLKDLPPGVLQVVTEWMQSMGQQELTFSIHENKLTLKGTSFYRTTF